MVAAYTVLLLNLSTSRVEACSCAALTVCEIFEGADVVLRGTVLSRR